MSVSVWAVFGIVLLLLGLPLAFYSSAGSLAVGAGVAFLIVATCNWVWQRSGQVLDDPDLTAA